MSDITSAFADQSKEKWFEKFARFGLVCKGIVYFLMGALSILAALGLNSEKGDKAEAFNTIYEQPFGRVILIGIAVGLFGYVMLRMFQAFKDIDNKGKDLKGIMDRMGYALSALLYLGIGAYAIKLVFRGTGGGSDSREFIVSKLLEYPAGQYIIGTAALILVGMGVYQTYRGVSGKFMKKIKLVRSGLKEFFKNAGTIGYIARGIVLVIIGYFLFRAALQSNPAEAGGTSAAFDFLENRFGSLMMAIVALGLVGYGIFTFVKARYQKIDFDF